MNTYNIFLPHTAISRLSPVRDAVFLHKPVGEIVQLANQEIPQLPEVEFPHLYSSILLAKQGRVQDAKKILRDLPAENAFASYFKRFLDNGGILNGQSRVFTDNRPYDAWTKTGFYKEYKRNSVNVARAFLADALKDKKGGEITVLDVGTGNGVFITDIVNSVASELDLTSVKLVLLDKFEAMVKSALEYCREHLTVPVDIDTICSSVEDLQSLEQSLLAKYGKFDFVNAAASLHHMPADTKVCVLSFLRAISQFALVTEFEANHDLPEADSAELVYSVTQHYKYYFQDVIDADIEEQDKDLCIFDFLLAEALVILGSDREHRVDYHTTRAHWESLALKAGFNLMGGQDVVSIPDVRSIMYALMLAA